MTYTGQKTRVLVYTHRMDIWPPGSRVSHRDPVSELATTLAWGPYYHPGDATRSHKNGLAAGADLPGIAEAMILGGKIEHWGHTTPDTWTEWVGP